MGSEGLVSSESSGYPTVTMHWRRAAVAWAHLDDGPLWLGSRKGWMALNEGKL